MQLKKRILDILLFFVNRIVTLFPIKENQIAFISLESKTLESDLLLLYQELQKQSQYQIKTVLTKFDKNNLWTNFVYMLNTFKQVYYVNRSKVVIINNNNYVVSRYKRQGVQVIQVWHATGAIKKFGNAIKREYKIANYDYVVANSAYWIEPYSEAFGVTNKNIEVIGMPRVDHLVDRQYIYSTREQLLLKYPLLQGKKVILYAPTFRGNIYQGFQSIDFDGKKLIDALGDDYVIIYKYHPLLKGVKINEDVHHINMSHEDIHDLFTISDCLISDYSSIIFDFSLLNKPMVFYVPDLQSYNDTIGCFVDYTTMPGAKCQTMEEVIEGIKLGDTSKVNAFKDMFFTYQDGKNTSRVVHLIKQCMENRE